MKLRQPFILALVWAFTPLSLSAEPFRVAASSRVYRDLAEQVGGAPIASEIPSATTGSPDLSHYALLICDTSAQDAAFRAAAQRAARPLVVLASTTTRPGAAGERYPWLDTQSMARFAHVVATAMARLDPGQAETFQRNAARYDSSLKPVRDSLGELARSYAKTDVFLADDLQEGLMAQLGFTIEDRAYLASTRDRTPRSEPLRSLLHDIGTRKASILIYNRDETSDATQQIIAAADDAGVPVVGLNERLPSGLTYQQWMLRQLNTIRGALNEAAP